MWYRMLAMLLVGGLVFVSAASVLARPHRGHSEEIRKKIMEKYDKDGDGKLSESEKKAMREAWSERRSEMHKNFMKKYDTNKDGKIGDADKKAMRETWAKRRRSDSARRGGAAHDRRPGAHRGRHRRRGGPSGKSRFAHFMKKYDKNKDGALDKKELEAVRKSHAAGRGRSHGSYRGGGRRSRHARRGDPGPRDCPHCGRSSHRYPGHGYGRPGHGYHRGRSAGRGYHGRRDDSSAHGRRHRGHYRRHGHWAAMKKKVMEKYDANKDGELGDDEKKTMHEVWTAKTKNWRAKVMEKYDANKDGKLDGDERKAAWAAGREARR